MKKLSKFLSVFLAATLALTGCGTGVSLEENTLVFAMGGEPQYLDSATSGDTFTNFILNSLYEGLFSSDEEGNLQYELCESYEVSDDGLVYTFNIKDATWSDGVEITAHDFVYGMSRSIGFGPSDSYYSTYITKYVTGGSDVMELFNTTDTLTIDELPELGFVALDDKTLEITLETAVPYFTTLMLQPVYNPMRADYAIELESAWANDASVPTSGPFVIDYISDGEEVVLVKNDNYRLADEVELEEIVFKIMTDQDAQLNAFKAGEIDFAQQVPDSTAISYDGSDELFIIDPYVLNYFITMNTGAGAPEALQNVNIRKGINYAINREDLLIALDGGDTNYELNGFVPKGIPGVDGDFRTEQDDVELLGYYDFDLAVELLTGEGVTTDTPIDLTYFYSDSTQHRTVAEVLQAQLKEVGINLILEAAEIQVFFTERTTGEFELARHANSADYLDPMNYLEMYSDKSLSAQANPIVVDETYNALLEAANAETDATKRMELLHEAENYFVGEQAYVIPLFGWSSAMLCSTNVTGIRNAPDGSFDFRSVTVTR